MRSPAPPPATCPARDGCDPLDDVDAEETLIDVAEPARSVARAPASEIRVTSASRDDPGRPALGSAPAPTLAPPRPSRAARAASAPIAPTLPPPRVAPAPGLERLRVSVRTSVRDPTLLVVRLLPEGAAPPAGTREALLVLTNVRDTLSDAECEGDAAVGVGP